MGEGLPENLTKENSTNDKLFDELYNEILALEESSRENVLKSVMNVDDGEFDVLGMDNSIYSLVQSMQVYETPGGIKIVAGSDRGIGYKFHNEDRVAVSPGCEFVVVVDGMGGEGQGDKAANISIEELIRTPDDQEVGAREASKRINKECPGSGAAFISARILREEGKIYLEESYLGDCQLLLVRDGEVKFVSGQDSYVLDLVKLGGITADQALYSECRNVVTGGILQKHEKVKKERIEVQSGDRVLLMSDGISDNLTSDEIAESISGLSPGQAMKKISDITDQRMIKSSQIKKEMSPEQRAQETQYPDGYKSMPRKDNRAFVIMDI